MNRLKNFLTAFIWGAVGGLLAGILVLPFFIRKNFLNTAVIFDKVFKPREIITRIEEKPIIVPKSDYFTEALAKVKNSVVAVESFSQNRLVRTGSGVIVTQDGLIFTVNSVVPIDATIIQVISSGKLIPARVVYRNPADNVAIISVPENNLQVVRLEDELPEIAKNILILSKSIEFGKDQILITSALISQINEGNETFKISLPYDQNLFGSALIDNQGRILGMLDFKGLKPVVISVEEITDDLNAYLAKDQK